MKNIGLKIFGAAIIAAVCFGFAFYGFLAAKPKKATFPPEIKIMSFNMRFANTTEQNPENNWDNRKEYFISVLRKYDADIIGFQEATGRQNDFIASQAGDVYDHFEVYRTIDPDSQLYPILRLSDESSSVFYRKDRFTPLETSCFWLSETPGVLSRGWDAAAYRICTKIVFLDNATGKKFTYYNAHFDHKGTVAREESAKLICSKVLTKGEPAIVTGDMNIKEGSSYYDILLSGNLIDAKFVAPDSDTGRTAQEWNASVTAGLPIDYILVTADFEVFSYKILRDVNAKGNPPSDHFPILSVIKQK